MFQITNLTKLNPLRQLADGGPKIPWKKIKEEILGRKYELSLVFAGNALMKKLNKKYRKNNQPASVLSFNLSQKKAPRLRSTALATSCSGQGEIFINSAQKKHSLLFLFIHALLHLKGFKHSAKMEAWEQRLTKKYEKRYSHRA